MKVGIIGLPGSGKSTLFQLISETFEEPDYSLAPNKPRLKRVVVRDAGLERLRADFEPKKYTPAAVNILDFPGVSKDGQDRSGLADLLAPAREVDALLVVLRAFRNPALPGGEAFDPVLELDEVRGELVLSDLVTVERRQEKLQAKRRKPSFTDQDKKELELLERIYSHLEAATESGEGLAALELNADDKKVVSGFGFLSTKPFVPVINSEDATIADSVIDRVVSSAGVEVLTIPLRSEVDILELPEDERGAFLEEYGIEELHRDEIIAAAYRAAGAISFFTAGEKEVRAWTIRQGDTAYDAAGAIHTDFQRGFIRAEVVSFSDYSEHGGIKRSKEAGVYRLEGKDYLVQDSDILEFRFSV